MSAVKQAARGLALLNSLNTSMFRVKFWKCQMQPSTQQLTITLI